MFVFDILQIPSWCIQISRGSLHPLAPLPPSLRARSFLERGKTQKDLHYRTAYAHNT